MIVCLWTNTCIIRSRKHKAILKIEPQLCSYLLLPVQVKYPIISQEFNSVIKKFFNIKHKKTAKFGEFHDQW
jgi:hypothetical protein